MALHGVGSARLSGSSVYRGGATEFLHTADKLEDTDVRISSLTGPKSGFLCFDTSIRSKGGGRTRLKITIPKSEFSMVLDQMMLADPKGSLDLMLRGIRRRERVVAESGVWTK